MPRAPKKTETTPTVRAKRTRRATDTPATIAEVLEVQTATPVTEAEISRLAYQIYQARGGVNGSPLEDWLEAERQLATRSSARSQWRREPTPPFSLPDSGQPFRLRGDTPARAAKPGASPRSRRPTTEVRGRFAGGIPGWPSQPPVRR